MPITTSSTALNRLLILVCLCTIPVLSSHAEDAAFDSATGVLTLPVVNAPGVGILRATLNLSSSDPIQFSLLSADIFSTPPALDTFSVQVQNGNTLYIPRVIVGSEYYELNMSLLSADPFVFGNLQVLSVTPVPAPEPEPDPLEVSINNGQTLYAQQCASCHGVSGNGTIQAPSVVDSSCSTFSALRNKINTSMPQGNSSACVDSSSSTCATDISNYIINRLRKNS
jgi:cytochrome c553